MTGAQLIIGDPATRLQVRVAYGGHPMSVNEAARVHGTVASRRHRPWKVNAITAGRSHAGRLPLPLGPSLVRVTLPMPDDRRRDPHNYTGTVVKAIIDGLVHAGWWEDDTADHVVLIDSLLVKVPGLATLPVQARCSALVDVVPLATMRAALAGHPDLLSLFRTV